MTATPRETHEWDLKDGKNKNKKNPWRCEHLYLEWNSWTWARSLPCASGQLTFLFPFLAWGSSTVVVFLRLLLRGASCIGSDDDPCAPFLLPVLLPLLLLLPSLLATGGSIASWVEMGCLGGSSWLLVSLLLLLLPVVVVTVVVVVAVVVADWCLFGA